MPKVKMFNENEVLDKAIMLFNKKGYNGTSMDELVQATGLSRSSIYGTFGDKYSLYTRSLEHYQQQSSDIFSTLDKIKSPRKKIQAFFDAIILHILNDDERKGCLMVNAMTELAGEDANISGITCATMTDMEDRFYQWIKAGQQAGEINKTYTAKALARHLYNTLTGLRVIGKTRPDKTFLKDAVKVALAILEA